MKNDLTTIITRAEESGASFRLREGQVEIRGLDRLPDELLDTLRSRRDDLAQHLLAREERSKAPEVLNLLAWATELAEQGLVLSHPVRFAEAPLRNMGTPRVSECATMYLRIISRAHTYRRSGGWGHFTPEWWSEREREALGALEALRDAIDSSGNESN